MTTGAGLAIASRHRIVPFEVLRATSLAEAVAAVTAGATPMAGGIDLVDRMKRGGGPSRVVLLRDIPELRTVTASPACLAIGAAVRHAVLAETPDSLSLVRGLRVAFAGLANLRIRDRGTVGGNVMAKEPGYEVGAILAALGAEAVVMTDRGAWRGPVLEAAGREGLLVRFLVPSPDQVELRVDRSVRDELTIAIGRRPGSTRIALALPERSPLLLEDPATLAALDPYRRLLIQRFAEEHTA